MRWLVSRNPKQEVQIFGEMVSSSEEQPVLRPLRWSTAGMVKEE